MTGRWRRCLGSSGGASLNSRWRAGTTGRCSTGAGLVRSSARRRLSGTCRLCSAAARENRRSGVRGAVREGLSAEMAGRLRVRKVTIREDLLDVVLRGSRPMGVVRVLSRFPQALHLHIHTRYLQTILN